VACIGPAISGKQYEISEDFHMQWREKYPDFTTSAFCELDSGSYGFDATIAIKEQLLRCGVKEENIETSGICTASHEDFYSYRAEKGKTGRFAMIAAISS